MGNSESVEIPGGGSDGFHVLRVQENSPGAKAGLIPFFDFIISINGVRLNKDDGTLKNILKNGVGKSLPVTIYSCKTQNVRSVTVEPSDSWGGQGLLGISIRFCSFEIAKDNVWHILEVHPNSPADLAGLKAFSDYIIGSESILQHSDDIYSLIESHNGRSLKLFVYNYDDDACREVTITPNSRWGGEGLVGCGIGYGYLHRIPVRAHPDQIAPTYVSQPNTSVPLFNSTLTNTGTNTASFNISPTKASESSNVILSSEKPGNSLTESSTMDKNIENIIQDTQKLNIIPSTAGQSPVLSSQNINSFLPNLQQPSVTSNIPPPVSLPEFNTTISNFQTSSLPNSNSIHIPPPSSVPQVVPTLPQVSMYNPANYPKMPSNPSSFSYSEATVPPPLTVPQVPATPQVPMYNPSNYPKLPSNPSSFTYSEAVVPQPVLSHQVSYPQAGLINVNYPQVSVPGVTTPNLQTHTSQLIYDPTIAARSAQQLLNRNADSFGNVSQNT
ncbi:Golgi reassembly-stacking protein 2 [Sitophilus oryzae]|uniref:Golgi reassembly-stacking protein 2 n=1 Tax=Sitophilus oryzae TaxID=7048 RepID=A0A6J2XCV6_SITOR|nr:Golgi reassembly-stacking protein 2 [Sitophilus oryzae]